MIDLLQCSTGRPTGGAAALAVMLDRLPHHAHVRKASRQAHPPDE